MTPPSSSPASVSPFAVRPTPVVAVIGGATAGAEVAARLAQRGVQVVVFGQNPRPFGKIEDGLPRWHKELRHKEYRTISEKLSRPGVHFVPRSGDETHLAARNSRLRSGARASRQPRGLGAPAAVSEPSLPPLNPRLLRGDGSEHCPEV